MSSETVSEGLIHYIPQLLGFIRLHVQNATHIVGGYNFHAELKLKKIHPRLQPPGKAISHMVTKKVSYSN